MALLPIFLLLTAQICPPQEDIHPCLCKQLPYGANVFCTNIETDAIMERVFTNLRGHKCQQLTISRFNASTLRPDVFKGLHIERLDLDRIEVDDASFRPSIRHFQGLEGSLEVLDIKKSFITRGLTYLQLNHLLKLKDAIFEQNKIPEVDDNWFNGGPSGLSTLIFEKNGIEVLGDRAFSSLSNLKTLAVAGNYIRELKRSMFPESANQLQMLDLASNSLRELPTNLFSDMPSLIHLNLENNFIHLMHENTFSSILSGNTQVFINGNPLECSENLKWVCKSSLNGLVEGKCSNPGGSDKKTIHLFCEE
ncbi:hypothetical protein JTE90_000585 [Oedothorax gibbosus]|uniref:Uncharacterized protein n=1 Tax=Oedothorax gibbosus TaxID=931172 RepID=A0AAV6VXP7_9ARAC|nr:hypothetical protein JTE90_000585 [Oedothorax gibbosus]